MNTPIQRLSEMIACLAVLILSIAFSPTVHAASGSWLNTGAANATWSTTSNWVGGTVPGLATGTTNADTATFNTAVGTYGTIGTPIVIDSGRNIKSITFDLAAVGAYTIGATGGNALLLTSAGAITMNSAVANTETINAPLVMEGAAGTYALTNNAASSSALLNIGGGITGGAAGATVLTLSGTNTGNNTISGIIGNGTATTLAVTKTGTGTWTLSGANTYTGGTTVTQGKLNINNAGALGSGTLSVGDATIDNTSGSAITLTGNNPLTVAGNINFGGTNDLNLGTGAVTNGASRTFTLNGTGRTLTLGGIWGNSADLPLSLSVNGVGNTLALGGFALENAGTTSRSQTITGTANIAITGPISNGSSGVAQSLFVSTTGTTTLSGANTLTGELYIYSGPVNINNASALGAGTFHLGPGAGQIDNTSGGAITNTANNAIILGTNLTFVGSNDLNLGNGAVTGLLGKTITLNGTGRTLTLGTSNDSNWDAILAVNGAGNTLVLGGIGLCSAASTRTQVIQGTANVTVTGAVTNGTGGVAQNLTYSGSGTLTLSGANTYTGLTTVSGGTLLLDKTGSGALSATSALTLGGGTFRVKGAASGASAQTLGALSLTGVTNNRIALDPNNSGAGSTTLTLGDAWTRVIGASLLIDYSSANTGTRQVVTGNATTGVTLSNGIYGAILVKDTAGTTGFATRAAGTNQAITRFDDTTGSALAANSNNATLNFTTLNSGGNLTWTNGGALTARSVNSLTIDTSIAGGTINMGAATNILTLTSNGILFKGDKDATLTGGLVGANFIREVMIHQTGSGTLTINSLFSTYTALIKDGTGTLVLGAANTYTDPTDVNEGVLNIRNDTALGTIAGGVKVADGAALQIQNNITVGAEALTLNGRGVSNDGALRNMSGNNTYGGAVTLGTSARINSDAGMLTISNGVTGATFGLTVGGAGNTTVSSIIGTTTGTLTKDGSGVLALSGVNTYTGATLVTSGTLVLSGSGSINSSALTVNGGTLRNNSSTNYTGALTFTSGTVGGTNLNGSLGGLTIGAGQTLSPGNSPGNATTTSQTWAGGGTYVWEINNAIGTAGADPGWDLLSGSGALTITASPSSKFNIAITSLDPTTNAAGNATNFNGLTTNYKWKIADFLSAITLDPTAFTLNTSAFSNAVVPGSTWAIVLGDAPGITGGDNTQLWVTYSIPEPSTWALLAFSLTTVMVLRRRRNS